MKFYLYANKTNIKEYTIRLIQYLFQKNGIDIVGDPIDSDIVMVSICDSTEISDIEKAKKYGKPVIVGGMISETPIINELADYVYHGEIYGIVDHLKNGGLLDDCEYITTKKNKKLKIYQNIRYEDNPIIRVGSRAAYYYCGKGCPVKCKYCLIGSARKYQTVPQKQYRAAERAIKKSGGRMMPIAAYNPYAASTERNITEVLLKKYVKYDGLNLGKSLIRSGVEFCTERMSRGLAKNVNINDINKAIAISKRDKGRMILYFIAGLESQNEWEFFFNNLSKEFATTPVITGVFTYLSPQPMTPLYDLDLRCRVEIDAKKIFAVINQVNKRIRVMPLANIKKSTIRSLMERSVNIKEYNLVKELSKKKYTYQDCIDSVEKKHPHLLGSSTIDDCLKRKRGCGGTIGNYWD